jgi:hypothetical protein
MLVFLFVIMLGLVLSVIFQKDQEPVKGRRKEPVQQKKPEEPGSVLPEAAGEADTDDNNALNNLKADPVFTQAPYDNSPVSQAEPEPAVTSALSRMDNEDFSSLFTENSNDFDQEMIDRLFADEDPEFDVTPAEGADPVPEEDSEKVLLGLSPAEIVQKGIRMAWPESNVMMNTKIFGDAILYEWAGLVKSEKVILFDLKEKGLAYPFMECARKISEANQKPSVRFACLIHTGSKKSAKSRDEAAVYLRSEEHKPVCLISDSAGVMYDDQKLERYGFLTVGSRPSLTLKCDADAEAAKRLAENSAGRYKMDDLSETAKEAFARMKNDLPASCRSVLKGGAKAEKAVKKIAGEIPETAEWALPSASVSADPAGSLIRLCAPDQHSLENALAVLREEARGRGYALRAVSGQKGSVAVSAGEEAFRLAEQALKDAAGYETVLPVLCDEPYGAKGIQSVGIAADRLSRREIYALFDTLIK